MFPAILFLIVSVVFIVFITKSFTKNGFEGYLFVLILLASSFLIASVCISIGYGHGVPSDQVRLEKGMVYTGISIFDEKNGKDGIVLEDTGGKRMYFVLDSDPVLRGNNRLVAVEGPKGKFLIPVAELPKNPHNTWENH